MSKNTFFLRISTTIYYFKENIKSNIIFRRILSLPTMPFVFSEQMYIMVIEFLGRNHVEPEKRQRYKTIYVSPAA